MTTPQEPLTHSVDIDLVGVTKLKSVGEAEGIITRLSTLHGALAEAIGNPDHVHCRECGRKQEVDAATCLKSGWPKCCGFTMTVDCDCETEAQP